MFHVKICGVTTAADAELVAAAGADAIGLNFVPGSPRQLDLLRGREVAAAIPAGVLRVGVFAGMPAVEILRIARALALDAIQLHGHLNGGQTPTDPPERCGELAGLPVIRAVRLEMSRPDTEPLAAARQWIAAATASGGQPAMVIVDAAVSRGTESGRLGGTGELVDWTALARPNHTVAIYMGLSAAGAVSTRLIAAGRDGATPALIVVNASRADEQRIAATLATLAQAVEGVSGPAVLIVGEAMALVDVSGAALIEQALLEAAQ